ncbi:MAG: alanine--tRNA ligase [Candidatus Doudnabacteria bacterium RIFCSPHIGHO2_01_FULL_50_11]|uniref:Alanine--tRNA ligase n=1 Tax=Candidatus Doudnabacteria bacterium RIFCSPHIGHO2_01_FULL_50_11 TaxID=1817828 RepID=A0A1F5PH82_9BACT|nr:MAG: alanine--tRNA ligase [Candidatus Doudnabacteria bacterium RIFCSPHIGHO2_01_FULL_50_11]HLC44632.1 alanine--tRNA ligase [Patescibacteria group bacterium]
MKAQELRAKYLDFFRKKGHAVIPSASLVPANDPTVLFTTAGMHPLVPYLLGEEHPAGSRIASVQKCIRTGDIEEVGDDIHLTFFEMLGNWSLGDYFKEEAIAWSWEFLTAKKYLDIDPRLLSVSCFAGDATMGVGRDDEAAGIWQKLGVLRQRIAFLGVEDNWWGPAGETGPCGPDTEMFYWTGPIQEVPETFDPKDGRWVEIWNDVFMQYNKTTLSTFEPLSQKNVDTGMGLDRMLAAFNGHRSVYDTELFKPMFDVLGKSQEVMSNDEVRKARVILDHVRASVFIIADGVEPSNKDRGYVVRRLLRRSMVHGKLLGLKDHWLEALVGKVITIFDSAYPELVENSQKVFAVIGNEQRQHEQSLETAFTGTLTHVNALVNKSEKVMSGKEAFGLYQTMGIPLELIQEIARSSNIEVDTNGYEAEFEKHQKLSRTASVGKFRGGLADHSDDVIRLHTATHLMNAALRRVLGEHVWQKGSNITKERTRFDFTHSRKLTPDEIKQVESLVNGWIAADLKVKKEIMPLERARSLGAIGVFGEKYPETVSVYSIVDPKSGDVISREFCGGPHVEHAGVIGKFKITKEEAISAGVRRIKAVVGS